VTGPEQERRDRTTQILSLLDLVNTIVRALLGIFGKRQTDK
jgi:hypothetical protein